MQQNNLAAISNFMSKFGPSGLIAAVGQGVLMHQIEACIRKTHDCAQRLKQDALTSKNEIAIRNALTIQFIALEITQCHNLSYESKLAVDVCEGAYYMAIDFQSQGWQHVYHDICNEYETARLVREQIEKKSELGLP